MFNSKQSLQSGRHPASFEDAYIPQPSTDAANYSISGDFKHPGQYTRVTFPHGHSLNKHSSPAAPSESDKSSPPEVFSPACSATSSATSTSSDSSTGIASPAPSSASWAGSSVSTTGTDSFLPPSYPTGCTGLLNGPPLRPNPRRTAVSASWTRPALVRQEQRRQHLVEQLLDSATQLVSQIWPTANTASCFPNKVISLKFYIRETLRRSRTSYSTLQVTLWYLVLIRPFVATAIPPRREETAEGDSERTPQHHHKTEGPSCALQCGRRMFLSALILASKYLQDRNFTARAWSKITGLPSKEIVSNESMFLANIAWNLHMKEQDFKNWNAIILSCTGPTRLGQRMEDAWSQVLDWVQEGLSLKNIVERLSVQRQAFCSNSEFGAYNQMAALFTPSSSFTSSSETSPVAHGSPPDAAGIKASPAISVASDSSLSSSFSFNEVKVPAARYGEPSVRRSTGFSCSSRQTARQLLTPTSSFDTERCEELQSSNVGYGAMVGATWNPIDTMDPSYLIDAFGHSALITTSRSGTEADNGMRASAQQPLPAPHCSLERSTSWLNRPNCGLAQRSIAHGAMKQPSTSCGHKRSASGMSARLTPLNGVESAPFTKFRCTEGVKVM